LVVLAPAGRVGDHLGALFAGRVAVLGEHRPPLARVDDAPLKAL
jgi:hypothetical protein